MKADIWICIFQLMMRDVHVKSPQVVTPAEAGLSAIASAQVGVHSPLKCLDPRMRRDDKNFYIFDFLQTH